jgi:hypothetical protein
MIEPVRSRAVEDLPGSGDRFNHVSVVAGG